MKTVIIIIVLVIVMALITDSSAAGRKGKDKLFNLKNKTGKSMLDDFDQERKDLDNMMK